MSLKSKLRVDVCITHVKTDKDNVSNLFSVALLT